LAEAEKGFDGREGQERKNRERTSVKKKRKGFLFMIVRIKQTLLF
jgi:hypothetical protein